MPNGIVICQFTSENDLGQPTEATSGSVSRTYGYTGYGLPTFSKLNNGALQQFTYSFDAATGNLTSRSRKNGNNTITESFTYDNLGRLTSADGNTISYDAKNNITSKGGVGTMSYNAGTRPYNITGLQTSSTATLGTANQGVFYTAYDRTNMMMQGLAEAYFTYDASHSRVKMLYYDAAGDEGVNYYVGGRYEIRRAAGTTTDTQLLYLGGDAYSAPMVLRKQGSGSWTPYVIGRDYQGSITHIATTGGTLVEERSYDAWGRLRDPATNAAYDAASQPSLFLGRGWCGHEYLADFGLFNLNARLYDPVIGRFLSPDPYVQAPDNPANFNRYSYGLNNPLKYTDESGEFWNIVIGSAIGGIGNVIANWKFVKQNGLCAGLGFFAIGAAVGALSSLGAAWSAGLFQAGGVWAGSLVGAGTGAVTGAASNALTTFGNNLLSEKSWDLGLKEAAINGAIMGGLAGAISGGVQGYRLAKENGAKPWTNRIENNTYKASVKKGVSIQPNPERDCYAYAAEYADMGHGNHHAADFIAANGNNPGGDFTVLNLSEKAKYLGRFSADDILKQLDSFGPTMQSNLIETAGTISNDGVLHWVNVIGVSKDKLSWFGGKIINDPIFRIWNPASGTTTWIKANNISNFTLFRF